MGIELEILVLFVLQTLGTAVFAVFEVETPRWKKVVKWLAALGLTLAVYRFAGHWALAVPVALTGLGLGVHLGWCRKHGIHPIHATPRRRYYALRGWAWVE